MSPTNTLPTENDHKLLNQEKPSTYVDTLAEVLDDEKTEESMPEMKSETTQTSAHIKQLESKDVNLYNEVLDDMDDYQI